MAAEQNIYQILRYIATAKSLDEICGYAYDILGNPIFVEDRASVKLAFSKNAQIASEEWENDIVKGLAPVPRKVSEVRQVKQNYENSGKEHLPIISTDSYMTEQRMIKALYADGQHVATVVAVGYNRDFTEDDVEVLEVISHFILDMLKEEHYRLSPSNISVDNLLLRLLIGEKLSRSMLDLLQRNLHWTEGEYYCVFDLLPLDSGLPDDESKLVSMPQVMDELRGIRGCYPVKYENHVVCLVRSRDKFQADERTEQDPLAQFMRRYHLHAGISHRFQDLNQMHQAYVQAHLMSNVSDVLKSPILLYPYDEYACYYMMDVAEEKLDLRGFCHQKILDLEAYDTQHGTDLVPTLHIYLETSRSISRTAEIMYIHRNTVNYRINKCFELLGTRIENGNELFSFTFSLRILEYRNKKKGSSSPF